MESRETQVRCDAVNRYVTKMAALGRQFEVGDLYNYRNDSILSDQRLYGGSVDSKLVTEIVSKVKVKSVGPDSGSSYKKWEHVGIDHHLRSSIVADIIKFSGSSRYLTDRCKPGQATRTLMIRLKSRKEFLDLQAIDQEDLAVFCGIEEGKQELFSQATHVIVGVVHGTQAYCVLTQEITNVEEDDDVGDEEIEENLSKITSKIEKALKENQNLFAFMGQFDDKETEQLTRVKCRLFADLQSRSVRECCVFDAYKHCFNLIQPSVFQNEAIPITVMLCPLKFIVPSTETVRPLEYRDVDPDLVIHCCQIFDTLNRIIAMTDAARTKNGRTHRVVLRQFRDAIAEYQEMLQKNLKIEILKAREKMNGDEEIKRIVEMAQNHPLFKPSRLERWFRYKQSEVEMIDKMVNMKGIVFFANRNQLERELADTFDNRFALVLRIPPVDEKTNAILETMRDYLNKCTKSKPESCDEDADEEDELPWHTIQRKRKQVLDRIREFSNYVEKNKQLEDQIQFFITFCDAGKGGCHYSIYEADNLLKDNLNTLPHPPTDLRVDYLPTDNSIEPKSSAMRVLWNYQHSGYPCYFLVEYRSKGSCDKSWMQRKTSIPGENQTIISFQKGLAMEIRVAANTCIGRSDFTTIIDAGFIAAQNNGHKDHYQSYCDYAKEETSNRDGVWLNQSSYTKLFISINSRWNPQPDHRRIAEIFALENSQLMQRGQPNIHLLNLKENSINSDFRWFDIGRMNSFSKPHDRRDHKVIMLMGATGSGKSTLINGMINHILGVQWNDPFRFKCVREDNSFFSKNQPHIPTNSVTAYTLRYQDGMTIPYSITIIDTPGYVNKEGGKRNNETNRKIQSFLTEQKIRIDQIHAVCFVAASNDIGSRTVEPYILDSVLSLFAKDVTNNIRLLVTFANMAYPPIVDAFSAAKFPVKSTGIAYSKFDNSVLFACNQQQDESCFDQLFWQMDQDNFNQFFAVLERMKPRDLGSTREVIQRRLVLDQSLNDIERGLEVYLVHAENIQMFGRKIKQYGDKMEANKDFLVDQTEVRGRRVNCEKGFVAYNCRHCRRTCEGPVRSINFDYIRKSKKQCSHIFCPCPALEHEYQRFQWRQIAEKVTTTLEEMKAEYESNFNDKLTTERLLADCQHQLKMTKAKLFCLLARVGSSCLLLEATAIRSNTLSLADYLSLMRNRVAEELAPGYLTRLEILTELQESLAVCAPENKAVQPAVGTSAIDTNDGKKFNCQQQQGYQLQFIEHFANSFAIGDC